MIIYIKKITESVNNNEIPSLKSNYCVHIFLNMHKKLSKLTDVTDCVYLTEWPCLTIVKKTQLTVFPKVDRKCVCLLFNCHGNVERLSVRIFLILQQQLEILNSGMCVQEQILIEIWKYLNKIIN